MQSSRGRQLNYDHRGLIHGERKVNVLWQQKWRGGGGSKIPFLLHNSAMLPTSKKTATMEDKLLEAALTVVAGCPAGAAAVVPEGVRTAVVVPEDAAVVLTAALHTPIAKKTGEKRLFECGPAYCQVSNYSVKTI